jgi:hypothetical protein
MLKHRDHYSIIGLHDIVEQAELNYGTMLSIFYVALFYLIDLSFHAE